jgi:hypothetical protein
LAIDGIDLLQLAKPKPYAQRPRIQQNVLRVESLAAQMMMVFGQSFVFSSHGCSRNPIKRRQI